MKDRFQYLALRAGAGLLGALPGAVARGLGERVGLVAYRFATRRRATARRHVRRLGYTGVEVDEAVRRMFVQYGRYWAETFWMRPRRRTEIEAGLVVEGLGYLEAAKAGGRGAVLATAHVGNWEVAGFMAERVGMELVAVAENLPNRLIRDWFIRVRNHLGIEVVLAGRSALRVLEQLLGQNKIVALLCDRDLGGKGVPVTFFGEKTTLPIGPVALAMRSGCALLPAASYFQPEGGHRVVIHPPISIPTEGGRTGQIAAGTQILAEALEELIRSAPDQWHLLQPNWPSDPR